MGSIPDLKEVNELLIEWYYRNPLHY